jgi:hypothetical protein
LPKVVGRTEPRDRAAPLEMCLTQIPGCPSKSDAVAGMAHFQGSGPAGTKCHSCFFYTSQHRSKRCGHCLKTQQLMGQRGAKIHGSNDSCRYYEKGGAR